MSERIAIIDLGSNSARLIIMKISKSGAYHLIYNQKEGVRLSEGLQQTNRLQPEAMQRALDTLYSFAHMCSLHKVTTTIAVATAAIRNAVNGQEFMLSIARKTNLSIRVISGEQEAHLGFVGAINTLNIHNAILFDLGGASTEITLIRNKIAAHRISLPIGAVNLTEKFELQDANADKIKLAKAYFHAELSKLDWLNDIKKDRFPLIGIGGTARNIAKMDQRQKNYPYPKIHNYVLTTTNFESLWKTISSADLSTRAQIPGLSTGRADIIVSGATIMKCLFEKTNAQRLIISACGIREGLFCEYYLSKYEDAPALVAHNITVRCAQNLLKYCGSDEQHATRVSEFALSIFDGLFSLHRLDDGYRRVLKVAAILHDIGISINYHDHPRHGAYLIENATLFGFSHREQLQTAAVVGLHGGYNVKFRRIRVYADFFRGDDCRGIYRLGFFLALAESLDVDQLGDIEKLRIQVFPEYIQITCRTNEPTAHGVREAMRLNYWCKREFGRSLLIVQEQIPTEV
ncbi:MAG: Ppx/GppA phosphatase family protein [Negativicutes bacterium]|jgi:exopolyphosphatase/guanosine-5'-triphosphate,3'-diphosphate pyrophosphatase